MSNPTTDHLERVCRLVRRSLAATRAGRAELAAELLDKADALDPIRSPLSRPPESYRAFFASLRKGADDE